jgi:hypothetical protein
MAKLAIRKFDGDSAGSYAVFYADAVKGNRGPIFWGEAQPIVSGLTKREADYYKKKLENG